MKIAILGGAFDPPHIGHNFVAQQIKERLNMDEVWLMVCYSYFPEFPDKLARITPYQKRQTMTNYIKKANIKISDFEEKHNKPSWTIKTLKLLSTVYPSDDFYWIIGSDQLKTFRLWNDWKTIISRYNIIVFPRDTEFHTLRKRTIESLLLKEIPKNITVMDYKDLIVTNISSTTIRDRVKKGLTIKSMVADRVENYIIKNKLYVA